MKLAKLDRIKKEIKEAREVADHVMEKDKASAYVASHVIALTESLNDVISSLEELFELGAKAQDAADYLRDMLTEGVAVGDRIMQLDEEDKEAIDTAIWGLESIADIAVTYTLP